MIHKKYFQILELFLEDYQKEIYGRGLTGKIDLSQKAIALALEELEKKSLLKSQKRGNMKFFRLNLLNSEIKSWLQVTELIRKINFLTKYRKMTYLFKEDERIIGVFGSYAKGNPKTSSDLDLFVVGDSKSEEYTSLGNQLGIEVSLKFFNDKEFVQLLKEKNVLIKEMIENHVLIFGAEKFINLVWRNFYGFN